MSRQQASQQVRRWIIERAAIAADPGVNVATVEELAARFRARATRKLARSVRRALKGVPLIVAERADEARANRSEASE